MKRWRPTFRLRLIAIFALFAVTLLTVLAAARWTFQRTSVDGEMGSKIAGETAMLMAVVRLQNGWHRLSAQMTALEEADPLRAAQLKVDMAQQIEETDAEFENVTGRCEGEQACALLGGAYSAWRGLSDEPRRLSNSEQTLREGERFDELLGNVVDILELSITADQERARLIASTTVRRTAVIGFALLAILLLSGLALTRSVTRSLSTLASGCDAIAAGDWDTRLELQGDDELGEVAAAFDKMTVELRETTVSRGYVRNVLESLPNALLVFDEAGMIHATNHAATELLGYTRDELLARRFADLSSSPPEVGPSREGTFLRGDGAAVPVRLSCAELRGRSSESRRFVCVAEDLTALHAAREEVAQRDDQLPQAQRLEAVGLLAGGVAHDFNNLLATIVGVAGLLLDDLDTKDQARADVEEILSTGMRAAKLTRQLLIFSRKSGLQAASIDVRATVESIEKLLRRTIPEDIALEADLDRDAPRIWVDESQLEQAVMNLVINARDAMPGGGTITVRTQTIDWPPPNLTGGAGERAPKTGLALSVTDTGTGMDEQTLSRVFDPFFTTKAPGRGTGLGLATVYGVVTRAGGTAEVRSRPGVGSTFTLSFPATDRMGSHAALSLVEGSGACTETILVVEDDPPVRQLVTRLLERKGYSIIVAESGQQAIDLLDRTPEPIDLLLTDVVMPGMSGLELAQIVESRRPGIAILFMSGYTGDTFERLGLDIAEIGLLRKPFTAVELGQRIRQRLAQASAPVMQPKLACGATPETGGAGRNKTNPEGRLA